MFKGTYTLGRVKSHINAHENLKKDFFERNKTFNFRKILKNRVDEILEAAYVWDDTIIFNNKYERQTILLNQLKVNKTNIKLNDTNERLLFYMTIMDKEFKLLSIYMEENHIDDIKKRCIEEGITYDSVLLQLEKHYNKIYKVIEDPFELKKEK